MDHVAKQRKQDIAKKRVGIYRRRLPKTQEEHELRDQLVETIKNLAVREKNKQLDTFKKENKPGVFRDYLGKAL